MFMVHVPCIYAPRVYNLTNPLWYTNIIHKRKSCMPVHWHYYYGALLETSRSTLTLTLGTDVLHSQFLHPLTLGQRYPHTLSVVPLRAQVTADHEPSEQNTSTTIPLILRGAQHTWVSYTAELIGASLSEPHGDRKAFPVTYKLSSNLSMLSYVIP